MDLRYGRIILDIAADAYTDYGSVYVGDYAQAGDYEFQVVGPAPQRPAWVYVQLNGKKFRRRVEPGQARAVFPLPAGPAMLDVWIQEQGRERKLITDNSTAGDVRVRRLR